MADPKSAALPLGDAPSATSLIDRRRVSRDQAAMPTSDPVDRDIIRAALRPLAAISTRPLLLSYQNASPAGTSLNVRARPNRWPATSSTASSGTWAARRPVTALP